jgi:hypothetical protein
MFTKGNELTMSRDNISALVTTITVIVVISVIIGFTIYFSNPSLNQAWSEQQQDMVPRFVNGHSKLYVLLFSFSHALVIHNIITSYLLSSAHFRFSP